MKLRRVGSQTYKTCRLREVAAGQAFVPAWELDDVARQLGANEILVRCSLSGALAGAPDARNGIAVCRIHDGDVYIRAGDQQVTLVDATVNFFLMEDIEEEE